MSRSLRIEYQDACCHVMSRGNARLLIFEDDADRELLLPAEEGAEAAIDEDTGVVTFIVYAEWILDDDGEEIVLYDDEYPLTVVEAVVDPDCTTRFMQWAGTDAGGSANIRVRLLPEGLPGKLTLRMTDGPGEDVTLVDGVETVGGEHDVPWNGRDADGNPVLPGCYKVYAAWEITEGVVAVHQETELTVVRVDIVFADATEEEENAPGVFLAVNDNDNAGGGAAGEGNGTVDLNDVTRLDSDGLPSPDPDLIEFRLIVSPPLEQGILTLTIPDNVIIWGNTYKSEDPAEPLAPGGDYSLLQWDLATFSPIIIASASSGSLTILMAALEGAVAAEGTLTAKLEIGAAAIRDEAQVVPVMVDLEFDSLPEETEAAPHEEDPGGFIALGDENLRPVTITLSDTVTTGSIELTVPTNVLIWKDTDRSDFTEGTDVSNRVPDTGAITKLIWNLPGPTVPQTLYLEGAATGAGDLVLEYKDPHEKSVDSDKVALTVVKVEVECLTNWQSWMPEGGLTQTDGNVIEFKAKVLPSSLFAEFVFELTETSSFEGYCMNAPATKRTEGLHSSTWRDLKFENSGTNIWIIEDDGQKASSNSLCHEDTVRIRSYDYAAQAQLTCKAMIRTSIGTTPDLWPSMTGCFNETGMAKLSLPRDGYNGLPQNGIADCWKILGIDMDGEANDDNDEPPGSPAVDDEEHDPPSGFPENYRGDGLTRFEEYRGFAVTENGATSHVRTDPTRMNVFIYRYHISGHISSFKDSLSLDPSSAVEICYVEATQYMNKGSMSVPTGWNSPGCINFQSGNVSSRLGDQFCIKLVGDTRTIFRDGSMYVDYTDLSPYPSWPTELSRLPGISFHGPPSNAPAVYDLHKGERVSVPVSTPSSGPFTITLGKTGVKPGTVELKTKLTDPVFTTADVTARDNVGTLMGSSMIVTSSVDYANGIVTVEFTEDVISSIVVTFWWLPSDEQNHYIHTHSFSDAYGVFYDDRTAHELGHAVSMIHHGGKTDDASDNFMGDQECWMVYGNSDSRSHFCTSKKRVQEDPSGPDNTLTGGACLYQFRLK